MTSALCWCTALVLASPQSVTAFMSLPSHPHPSLELARPHSSSWHPAAKAREAGFYLGCTTAWKWELDSSADGGRRWGTSALVTNRIVDRDLDTNVGRVTGPASGALRYWERVVAE